MTSDPVSGPADDPAARLARLEAITAIGQLVARYAITLDGRDARGWADLYVPDVRVGAPVHDTGRDALRRWFREKCSYWYRSMHVIGAHQIDLTGPDTATGLAQCRVEQEIGGRFVTTAFLYRDRYRRHDGHWLFEHRHGQPLWAYDQHTDPLAAVDRLPGGMPVRLPAEYPAFRSFWSDFPPAHLAAVTNTPVPPAQDP
jgi:ketosteroid isomerase-like protein